MTDVKDVFSAVLDVPAPPPRTRDEMLATVHGAARKRRANRIIASAAAVVAVSAATVAVPRLLPADGGRADHTAAAAAGATPTAAPEPSAAAEPSLPPAGNVPHQQHADKVMRTLVGRIPTRLGIPTDEKYSKLNHWDPGTDYPMSTQISSPKPPEGGILAETEAYSGNNVATAFVAVEVTGRPVPTGDLCAAKESLFMGYFFKDPKASGCKVITASDGTHIRFAWNDIDAIGRFKKSRRTTAVRFYPGGFVQVVQEPGVASGNMGEFDSIWSDRELAETANLPAFWEPQLAPFTEKTALDPPNRPAKIRR